MPQRITGILTYLLTLGLGIFLVWYSIKDLQADDMVKIKTAVSKANFWLLIPILMLGFVSHWSRAMRWRYMIEPFSSMPSVKNTFFAVMIGYLANMAFPRLGEVLKCTILAKYENIPADKLVGTIIAERVFDVLCLLLIFVITFLVQITFAKELLAGLKSEHATTSASDSNYTIIVIIALLLMSILFFLFRKKIRQLSFMLKLKSIAQNIYVGMSTIKTMKHPRAFFAHTF
jgi:Uncharacterised protein family (UPF0104).